MTIDILHSILKAELELIQKYIVTFSKTKDMLANKAIKHIVNNKGKMLRPILLILTARYSYLINNGHKKNKKHFIHDIAKAAAILELIQMSSLIHDDVLDQSAHRRETLLQKMRNRKHAKSICYG